jgi:transposase-like protein
MKGPFPMADELRMALAEVLRKAGVEQADFLREGVRVLAEELMEMELAEHVGADRHERTPDRTGDTASGRGIHA